MSKIIVKFWQEPAVFVGVGTVLFAAASGIWSQPWIGFGAAAFAGLGTILIRQNVTPVNPRKEG